jgi:hypothetical protein
MKKFTKLALAASVAFSANAMAMQAMDDASLSATTGQDGLTIGIGISKIEIEKLYIHDNDGYAGAGGSGDAGAIYIQGNGAGVTANHGVVIGANYDNGGAYLLPTRNLADLVIDSDAGDSATGGAFINIAAAVSGLDIHIGEVGVAASAAVPGTTAASIRRGAVANSENAILTGLSVKTGPLAANIQLGAAPQGAMIKLNATMVGGLTINNLGILDNSTKTATREAGEIFIEQIQLADAGSRDLILNQNISVIGEDTVSGDTGYVRIISTSGAHDNYVKGIHLGSQNAASIGDMEVQGLQTYFSPAMGVYTPGAIITIRGH